MAHDDYSAQFGAIVADIEAEMRAVRDAQRRVAPLLWEIIDYHFGWDGSAGTGWAAGKKVRPVLMALVARALCGDYQHTLPAGAALELIHNFTLIHDDVMDRSTERRHRPTVWTRWGSAQAINAGDGLYALAGVAVARLLERGVPAPQVVRAFATLSQACLWTAEGQILDMEFETRPTVTPEEYITMVTHKTGMLIEAATQIGALLSTSDEAVIAAYAAFGRHLGVAFQVRDDYLGVWGDEAQTGKSATSDIREKKKAYPVLVALHQASEADRAALQRLYAQPELSDDDVRAVLAILARVEAARHTEEIAAQYTALAMAALEQSGQRGPAQDQLRGLALALLGRTS